MIYLLEDDNSIRELVLYTLGSAGLEAEGFAHPTLFWEAMAQQLPDLVILDQCPLDTDPMKIRDIRVLETIRRGKTIYTRA